MTQTKTYQDIPKVYQGIRDSSDIARCGVIPSNPLGRVRGGVFVSPSDIA